LNGAFAGSFRFVSAGAISNTTNAGWFSMLPQNSPTINRNSAEYLAKRALRKGTYSALNFYIAGAASAGQLRFPPQQRLCHPALHVTFVHTCQKCPKNHAMPVPGCLLPDTKTTGNTSTCFAGLLCLT
jgi:hypothetical protein